MSGNESDAVILVLEAVLVWKEASIRKTGENSAWETDKDDACHWEAWGSFGCVNHPAGSLVHRWRG